MPVAVKRYVPVDARQVEGAPEVETGLPVDAPALYVDAERTAFYASDDGKFYTTEG